MTMQNCDALLEKSTKMGLWAQYISHSTFNNLYSTNSINSRHVLWQHFEKIGLKMPDKCK